MLLALVRALLHATLLHSTPASNAHLTAPPEAIRLVFSEGIVAELSHISLKTATGRAVNLAVSTDPHDIHILVGRISSDTWTAQCAAAICDERYTVSWHVVSADGHPVAGEFSFAVAVPGQGAGPDAGPVQKAPTASSTILPSDTSSAISNSADGAETTPIAAALLRGLGLTAVMGAVGLLFFSIGVGEQSEPRRFVSWLAGVGALLMTAHAVAWVSHLAEHGLSTQVASGALATRIGEMELLRTAAAVLTAWAVALARRAKLALFFGVLCLLVSGAIGHTAAIHSAWSIPAKILHLLSGSVWLGGLLWLVWIFRNDTRSFVSQARRVSSIALIAVIVVAFSGVNQTFLFLSTPSDLIRTGYGLLVLAKVAGLLILVALGAYNRYRLVPALAAERADLPVPDRTLYRSVLQEIVIMTIVIVLGGFLAYEPTPPLPAPADVTATGTTR
jgi:copper transport protein